MRRRFKSNSEFPLRKTTEDIARNRRLQKPSETSKAKRVRFDDTETDVSSRGHEATRSPRCGAPKTSEYAYFRKVKDGAVNGHFRALEKGNKQLNTSKVNYLRTETYEASEKLDPGTEGLNSNISGENPGFCGLKHFDSPTVSKYEESHEIRRKELSQKNKVRSPLLTATVTPVGQSLFTPLLNHATEMSALNSQSNADENQCIGKGIFSEKRKRLCQWVAQTTSSEVEKLHGKGSDMHKKFIFCHHNNKLVLQSSVFSLRSDLISLLLCRLVPKGNEKNDSSKVDADDSSKSPILHESDNLEKKLALSHIIDCNKDLWKLCSERSSEVRLGEWETFDSGFSPNYRREGDLPLSHKIECGHMDLSKNCAERSSEIIARRRESFDSGFPSNYRKEGDLLNKTMVHSGRTCEIVPSEWVSFDSRPPYNYHKEGDIQNKAMDPDQHSSSRVCNNSGPQPGFSFCLPFESFRSLGAFHFKNLDEFGPKIGHGREEPNRHSLEWDFGVGKGRADNRSRKDVCERLANAWNADQKIVVDNMLDTKKFSPSPLFSSRYLFNPLPNYVSTGCLTHEIAPNLDEVEYAMVEPGQLSLTFPCSPKCIPLAEDEDSENILSSSNIIFSYRDPRLSKKMVWDCTPRSEFWWKCLSAPEFSAEDHPSDFHAWEFPQSENGPYSLSFLKEAPGEPGTSFCEDAFNHSLLSSTLHSPLDAFMNSRLLLNHVKHDILDQELYSDDYENELRYRKFL